MLIAAIQNAIDNAIVSTFYVNGKRYLGRPMKMDRDFVAIACLQPDSNPPTSSSWILRIDRIDSICIAGRSWGDDWNIIARLDKDEPPTTVSI